MRIYEALRGTHLARLVSSRLVSSMVEQLGAFGRGEVRAMRQQELDSTVANLSPRSFSRLEGLDAIAEQRWRNSLVTETVEQKSPKDPNGSTPRIDARARRLIAKTERPEEWSHMAIECIDCGKGIRSSPSNPNPKDGDRCAKCTKKHRAGNGKPEKARKTTPATSNTDLGDIDVDTTFDSLAEALGFDAEDLVAKYKRAWIMAARAGARSTLEQDAVEVVTAEKADAL